ncbi:unnamed protein product [Bemisia tabaci]|uniref:Uncharacterized protein n=1 Tax=Bemisia tabaci TaxID=7038 RepID=A0A9P0EXS3_BEMTA|nr:unnamed protein product [Bemisia tabaci]
MSQIFWILFPILLMNVFSFVLSELPDEGGGILVRRNPLKERLIKRRIVHTIRYDNLKHPDNRGPVPVPPKEPGAANPYTRGCSAIKRCRS